MQLARNVKDAGARPDRDRTATGPLPDRNRIATRATLPRLRLHLLKRFNLCESTLYFHTVYYNSNLYIRSYNFCNVNTFYITNISIVYIHTHGTRVVHTIYRGAGGHRPRCSTCDHRKINGYSNIIQMNDYFLKIIISTSTSFYSSMIHLPFLV